MTRHRLTHALICSCLALVALLVGLACSPAARQVQAVAANTLALAANDAGPLLVAAERAEGDRAIDSAPDKASALVALAAVRSKWAPVWDRWAAVRAAQAAWATALETKATPEDIAKAAGALRDAYCALGAVTPPGVALAKVEGWGCP